VPHSFTSDKGWIDGGLNIIRIILVNIYILFCSRDISEKFCVTYPEVLDFKEE